jgi:hypothetical protein
VMECFNLSLNFRRLHEFKAQFSQYYDKTYRHILEKLDKSLFTAVLFSHAGD